MGDQNFDVLIAFHAVTTAADERGGRPMASTMRGFDERDAIGRILEVNWCVYDVKQQLVTDEAQLFVRPDKYVDLNEYTMRRTGIRVEDMQSAVPFAEVMARFNEYVFQQFVRNNISFCLVTYGDDLLTRILPNEATAARQKLHAHFNQYFDIGSDFRSFYPQTYHIKTLGEMLSFLKLKDLQGVNLCQAECKNMVRIVNRMIKDGYRFAYPKAINAAFQVVADPTEDRVIKREKENRRWSTFIRSRSPEPFKNPLRSYYIRIRGFPPSTRENDVVEFLRGIRVYKEDIAFLLDLEGKFSGEVYVKLANEADMKEALCLNLNQVEDRYVEVFETTENEFNKARASQFADQREVHPDTRMTIDALLRFNPGILKLRGLPYTATENDILNFFKGFQIMQDGIKRPIIGGKPSGEAFVLFATKEEAQRALTLNMDKIGNRFIELFPTTPREFENFIMHNFINSGPCYSKDFMPNIPQDKRRSTLMISGLPFNATKQTVIDFFSSFDIKERDVHMLPSHSGKFSGNALVIFEDEMECRRALKSRNLTYQDKRFIELYEYK
eukprot:TRINITY_DN11735_c0_g1_i1.p1 TRINITY_DN11735_c0_g1~~TRINITY_DN11735_c0_g1_i1.p1  ORF type:complete len:556 (-),score=144.87 TRINITY_DN11735_c0_g1_i1:181-1848(-)